VEDAWTPLKVLQWTATRFGDRGIDSARLDAEVLLAHVLATTRVGLYTAFDKPLGKEELASYRELVKRRLAGEPVAYLVGRQEFWSMSLEVDPRVLVPRRDTETLVEVGLRFARHPPGVRRLADVATGSGAVALALAKEIPDATVVATDVSEDALAVASANVTRLEMGARVELRRGDLCAPIAGESWDLIVSNPPYVTDAEMRELSAEVKKEPRGALAGGADGLDLIGRLVPAATKLLRDGGMLAIEHGWKQGEAVRAIFTAAGLRDVETIQDLAGRDRVTRGYSFSKIENGAPESRS
jgi:release factor glutamine methyltransferase